MDSKYIIIILFNVILFSIKAKAKTGFVMSQQYTSIEIDSISPVLYLYVDEVPKYVGGNNQLKKFIDKNLRWPTEDFGYNGTVLLSFIVEQNGRISNITVEKKLCGLCDAEALRILTLMPKWIPGKVAKKIQRVKMYIPIEFKIKE